jgi:hypothetical protein
MLLQNPVDPPASPPGYLPHPLARAASAEDSAALQGNVKLRCISDW